MFPLRRNILWLLLVLVTGCQLQLVERDTVTLEWQEGEIAFFSERRVPDYQPFATRTHANYVFAMTADGKQQAYFRNYGESFLRSPVAWSPNGTRFAISDTKCVLLVSIDGKTCLVQDGYAPSWSKDGNWIAFKTLGPYIKPFLKIIDLNTLEVREVAAIRDTTQEIASWSSDGKFLVFSQPDTNGDRNLWLADLTTTSPTTINITNGQMPAWSPVGDEIAFVRDGDIWVRTMDENGVETLLIESGIFPTWSPNGQQLAFASNRDGNWEIYKVNRDGSAVTNVTNNSANDTLPAWRP